MTRASLLPTILLLALLPVVQAAADNDHERARAALQRGEVLPLAEILARVTSEIQGEVIEAEFDREGDRWVYELKVIDTRGRVYELDVDAADGRILHSELDD